MNRSVRSSSCIRVVRFGTALILLTVSLSISAKRTRQPSTSSLHGMGRTRQTVGRSDTRIVGHCKETDGHSTESKATLRLKPLTRVRPWLGHRPPALALTDTHIISESVQFRFPAECTCYAATLLRPQARQGSCVHVLLCTLSLTFLQGFHPTKHTSL
jgi:hypothetical protein